ncbi:MAG: serine/threonine-protein kinase [Blastocatellia bacterium]
MKRCPKCRSEYADDDAFCGNDGEPLVVVEPIAKVTAPSIVVQEAETDPLIGVLMDGKYELERRLGSGGMGTVYVARHKMTDEQVAVKILNPDTNEDAALPERFKQEAEVAASIRHPNLVPVNDFGQTDDGLLYMVMEYVAGASLREVIGLEKRLSPARAVNFGCQICSAISIVHDAGIVHRDLKPENVVIETIDDRETARVLDFGIAKLLDRAGLTRVGFILGTPDYMSPEQASAQPLDHRSDIYSLGIILYELLSGIVPFSGPKPRQILIRHAIEMPRPISELRADLPEALARVCMRALEKSPAKRPQSAAELASELSASIAT